MRKNKAIMVAACLTMCLLCGCNDKKDVIYNKDTSTVGEEATGDTEGAEEIPLEEEKGDLPEMYTYQVTGELCTINVIAKVKAPKDYKRCPVVEFTRDVIEEEDIKTYADMVFDDDSYFLYMPYDGEQIENIKGKLTSIMEETDDSDLKKAIQEYHLPVMDFHRSNLTGEGDAITGEIKYYNEKVPEVRYMDNEFDYYYGSTMESLDTCGLAGTVDGTYYIMNFEKYGNNSCLMMNRMDKPCKLNDVGPDCYLVLGNGNTCTYSKEEAEEIALEFAKKLGYENMGVIQTNNVNREEGVADSAEELSVVDGYNVYLSRKYENYTLDFQSRDYARWMSGAYHYDEDGNMMIGSYECPETLRICVDSKGVCQVELWNPLKEENVVVGETNMISLEQANEIAEKEFQYHADNNPGGYTLDEVSLGYTLVRSGGNATLVPAWHYSISDKSSAYYDKSAMVIVNALDGTVEFTYKINY